MDVDFPVGFAPSAMQKMAHPDGEIGAARGKEDFFRKEVSGGLSSIFSV